jgi:hypothetical protein
MDSNLDDLNLWKAQLELSQLNYHSKTQPIGAQYDPVLDEVSKAMTLVVFHQGIEARVICDNVQDLNEAMALLTGPRCAGLGGVWNAKERAWEMPNGSAVVVKFVPKHRPAVKREAPKGHPL